MMKKLFVYLSLPVLISLQACNSNSTSNSTLTDSTVAADSTAGLNMNTDSLSSGDTTASHKKNGTRINASDVPAPVTDAFNRKYANVANVKWVKTENKKGKIIYRARWQAEGKKMTAVFKDDGSFIKEKQGK